MRIWLDPMKMAQYQVKLAEVTAAVSEKNSNVTVGDLGAEPSAEVQRLTLTLSAQPQFSSAPEFERILLRVDPDGSIVFLGDVVRIEIGQQGYGGAVRYYGNSAAGFVVNLATGSMPSIPPMPCAR